MQVDAITFYAERLRMLQSLMREARQRSLPPNENVIPTAFITFWTRKSQVSAWHRTLPSLIVCCVWRTAQVIITPAQ